MFLSIKEMELRKLRFDEAFEPGVIDFSGAEVQQSGALQVQGVAELLAHTGGEIRIKGRLQVQMESACDRCLGRATFPLDSSFDLFYRPASSLAREEEVAIDEGESEIGFYEGGGLEVEEILREQVLLLGQRPTIFNDTVYKNICFGLQASQSQVERACGLASLDEFVSELPKGLETMISYQGSNLSGGQCQRIGLARALLRQPQVLLLDESTSALDRATRDKVVKSIVDEYRDRIVVFSTHDLDIAGKVDEVIELPLVGTASSLPEVERVGE